MFIAVGWFKFGDYLLLSRVLQQVSLDARDLVRLRLFKIIH